MKNILVTGGAGFIGSNLVETLLEDSRIGIVRVIDNLSTGNYSNLIEFENHPKFQFIDADIRDFSACLKVCEKIDFISHQAALGSVPRSIDDPLTSNEVNVNGTLNIFKAAIEKNVKRVVFASSSSVYGDDSNLPKVENKLGNQISPYALTKKINEDYAKLFAKLYDFKFIALRYFNVYGPKQRKGGAYAAVVPIFFEKALQNLSPTINGDGSISRDFTFVKNAVDANICSMFTSNEDALNQAYNIACGERTTLIDLWNNIRESCNCDADAIYGPTRAGDVPHTLADTSKARRLMDYEGEIKILQGLKLTGDWYKKSFEEINS